jgi:hypothetical protein
VRGDFIRVGNPIEGIGGCEEGVGRRVSISNNCVGIRMGLRGWGVVVVV